MRTACWFLSILLMANLVFSGTAQANASATSRAPIGPPILNGIDLDQVTVLDLQGSMNAHHLTSVELTEFCLDRIRTLNPELHAVIETDPDALKDAAASDLHRRRHGGRGPLEGIPVLLKDNVATADRERVDPGPRPVPVGYVPPPSALRKRHNTPLSCARARFGSGLVAATRRNGSIKAHSASVRSVRAMPELYQPRTTVTNAHSNDLQYEPSPARCSQEGEVGAEVVMGTQSVGRGAVAEQGDARVDDEDFFAAKKADSWPQLMWDSGSIRDLAW